MSFKRRLNAKSAFQRFLLHSIWICVTMPLVFFMPFWRCDAFHMRFCAFSGITKPFHFLSIMNLLGFCDLKILAIIKLWDCLHCKSINYIYFSKLDKILQFNPDVYIFCLGGWIKKNLQMYFWAKLLQT